MALSQTSQCLQFFHRLLDDLDDQFVRMRRWGPRSIWVALLILTRPSGLRSYRCMLSTILEHTSGLLGWEKAPSAASFSKARGKLPALASRELIHALVKKLWPWQRARFRHHQPRRFIAIDGTRFICPRSRQTLKKLDRPHAKPWLLSHYPQALVVVAFDIVRRLPLDWAMLPKGRGERAAMTPLLETLGRGDVAIKAASLCPGDARAWVERAALAAEKDQFQSTIEDCRHAIIWAPIWPDIQLSILKIFSTRNMQFEQIKSDLSLMINRIISINMEQPLWFFPLAASIIGDEVLSGMISRNGNRLKHSAMPWLAERGELNDWLTLKHESIELPAFLPPEFMLIAKYLFPHTKYDFSCPRTIFECRQSADTLMQSGLPLPDNLRDRLLHSGAPWSVWATPIDIFDRERRHVISQMLRGELHFDWASSWSNHLNDIDRIEEGDWSILNRDTDPLILSSLASSSPFKQVPNKITLLSTLLLSRYQSLEWKGITDHATFSWVYKTAENVGLPIDIKSWSGLIIDGKWAGWLRGHINIAPLLGPGLHRLVLLFP
jgi:hypothetical protein